MSYYISKTNLGCMLLFWLSTIICIAGMIFMNQTCTSNDFENWARGVSLFIVLIIVAALFCLSKCGYSISSLPTIFLFIIVLFNYGQILLMGLIPKYEFYKSWNKWQIYPESTYESTALIVLISICAYISGVLLTKKKHILDDGKVRNEEVERHSCKKCGYIILLLTLPFNFIESILLIRASVVLGYVETHSLGISNYITAVGWLSTLGVVLLMFGAETEKKRTRVFLIFLVYYSIIMVSGNRGNSMCAIIGMLVFYFRGKHFDLKWRGIFRIVVGIFVAILLLIMLDTIREYRGASDKSVSGFMMSMGEHATNNLIFENIEEFGGTVAVISIVRIYLDGVGKLLYGWTYISGLFSFIPNFGGVSNSIVNSGSLLQLMKYSGNIYGRYTSIGSNFIAELILNFGNFWWIGMIVVGIITVKIYNYFIDNGDTLKSAYMVMPAIALIQWSRWSFSSLVRLIVWGAVLLWIVKSICIRKINE